MLMNFAKHYFTALNGIHNVTNSPKVCMVNIY